MIINDSSNIIQGDSSTGKPTAYSLMDFLSLDMKSKVSDPFPKPKITIFYVFPI